MQKIGKIGSQNYKGKNGVEKEGKGLKGKVGRNGQINREGKVAQGKVNVNTNKYSNIIWEKITLKNNVKI